MVRIQKSAIELKWSQKYYPGLTPSQHRANNQFADETIRVMTDNGVWTVPNIGKCFDKYLDECEFRVPEVPEGESIIYLVGTDGFGVSVEPH
jgi:hypothetical protein